MKKYILIIIIAFVLIPQVSVVHAEETVPVVDSYTLIEPLPCITGVTKDCNAGEVTREMDIKGYIMYVYKFALAISVFLAIIMIIWGGFLYITSEVPFIKSDGKSKIEGAVTGLALILVSYLILVTIDPRLVEVYSEIPPINIKTRDYVDLLTKYQADLANDLKNISFENQREYMQEKARIEAMKKQKAELEEKLDTGQIPADQVEETKNQIKRLAITTKSDEIEQRTKLAEYTAMFQYGTALSVLNDPKPGSTIKQYIDTTVPNNYDSKGYLPETSNNVIQESFNRRINDIRRFAESDGGTLTNFDEIQELEEQRDFFIEQVKDSVDVDSLVRAPRYEIIDNGFFKSRTIIDKFETELYPRLNDYKKDLVDEQKIEASGLPRDQYTKIIQTKIDTINKAKEKWGEAPPKP